MEDLSNRILEIIDDMDLAITLDEADFTSPTKPAKDSAWFDAQVISHKESAADQLLQLFKTEALKIRIEELKLWDAAIEQGITHRSSMKQRIAELERQRLTK